MPRVWAYCRVSTTKDEQEPSLDEQEAWARTWASSEGFDLRVFREQASAKTTLGRRVFQEMLAQLAALPSNQRPCRLLITSLDRLSRSTRDTLNVLEALRELRVQLHQRGHGDISVTTFPERAALLGMSMAGEAENYGRSMRMKASWEARRRAGKPTSNKVPYGLQLVGGYDVPIPESARWVLLAFERYDTGDSLYAIAESFVKGAPPHTWLTSRIDERGDRLQKTRLGTRWDGNRIRKLLEQRRYRGTIVDAKVYDRVQVRRQARPRLRTKRLQEYPLSGAMRCVTCARHLHGHASGGTSTRRMADGSTKRYVRDRVRYYACYLCHYRLNADRLERRFFDDVTALSADERLLRRWVANERTPKREQEAIRREILVLEAQCNDQYLEATLDRLIDLAVSARLTTAQTRRQVDRIRLGVEQKKQQLADLRERTHQLSLSHRTLEQARLLLRRFHELYTMATYDEKRALVESVVGALGGAAVSRSGLHWLRRASATEAR